MNTAQVAAELALDPDPAMAGVVGRLVVVDVMPVADAASSEEKVISTPPRNNNNDKTSSSFFRVCIEVLLIS